MAHRRALVSQVGSHLKDECEEIPRERGQGKEGELPLAVPIVGAPVE